MFAKTALYSLFSILAANQAMGAALPAEAGDFQILIATDACEYSICSLRQQCLILF